MIFLFFFLLTSCWTPTWSCGNLLFSLCLPPLSSYLAPLPVCPLPLNSHRHRVFSAVFQLFLSVYSWRDGISRLRRKELHVFPKITRLNLITLVLPLTSHRNRCTSLSSGCRLICKKALVMSAVRAYFHCRNRSRICTKFGVRLGPAFMQSFSDTPFSPLHEALKTGLILVVRLSSLTTGLCGRLFRCHFTSFFT